MKVGDGRGFVVERHEYRFVITVSHCLPYLPPCHLAAYLEEKPYGGLLGPIDGDKPVICAECLFVDPVNDLAILGTPDDQELCEQADL